MRVPLATRTRADFARLLDRVLSDDAMRVRTAETRPRFADERDGAEAGADLVEGLVARDGLGRTARAVAPG